MKKIILKIIAWFTHRNQREIDRLAKILHYEDHPAKKDTMQQILEWEKFRQNMRDIGSRHGS